MKTETSRWPSIICVLLRQLSQVLVAAIKCVLIRKAGRFTCLAAGMDGATWATFGNAQLMTQFRGKCRVQWQQGVLVFLQFLCVCVCLLDCLSVSACLLDCLCVCLSAPILACVCAYAFLCLYVQMGTNQLGCGKGRWTGSVQLPQGRPAWAPRRFVRAGPVH